MPDKLTVLVVDDSRTVRAAIRNHLREQFNIVEAEDGEAGWSVLSANPDIKLVISDIQMPNLDGYGFICRVRSTYEESIRKKPIIVITSAEDDVSRKRAYACGANDFVLKPLDFADLSSRLSFQIDADRLGGMHIGNDMAKYESAIEAAVLERPTIATALEVLGREDFGIIEPYVIELCLEVMPLLEHAQKMGLIDIEHELTSIKAKLTAQQF